MKTPNFTIKTLWGLAKSPQLHMNDEELHLLVMRETNKESIRTLTKRELTKVCKILITQKDSIIKNEVKEKRRITNKGGNTATENQRKTIYVLTGKLGWNDNNSRIDGFVKRMFNIDRLEWLNREQCSKLIEILKKMVDREQNKEKAVE